VWRKRTFFENSFKGAFLVVIIIIIINVCTHNVYATKQLAFIGCPVLRIFFNVILAVQFHPHYVGK